MFYEENQMKKIIYILLTLPAFMLLSACGGEIGANRYETSAVGQVNTAREGVIISVRQVIVSTSDGAVGNLAGGIAGGAAGSMIGGSSGTRVIGAVGGAVLGGMAGSAAQNRLSEQAAYEYVIRLDGGGAVTVTQGTDVPLSIGQRVVVLGASGGHRARVIPIN